MERAKWNGREYTASEIADDFEMEHAIRQISGRELFCPDPQCETPLLRYCHGEKKHAYFAHLQTGSCDYAQFDKQPGIIREVRCENNLLSVWRFASVRGHSRKKAVLSL